MLVGRSKVMTELNARLTKVASTDFTVLIEGESGVGKELAAREIHRRSTRRRGPFVAVNCAALVETLVEAELFGIEERTATGVRGRRGKFELAEDGTLFLDEVADLSSVAQAKLLRVLQDMTVERVGGQMGRLIDTRVVAATNRGLGDSRPGRPVPRGPLLPPGRRGDPCPAAAGEAGRHATAGRARSRTPCGGTSAWTERRGHGGPRELRLAG